MVKMIDEKRISDNKKVKLFLSLFKGLKNVYGTYSTKSGKHWQIKGMVIEKIIYNHLIGKQPYGFYPLINDKTSVGIADFDDHNPLPAIAFIKRAAHYGLNAYLEKSKSKGYHVWLFFSEEGVSARKLRIVMKYILDEIESPDTEIFPKQDSINQNNSYGNFINAPLFGKLVPEGKTVFIHADNSLKPYPDQWEFIETIVRNSEDILDSIIDNNITDVIKKNRNTLPKNTTINSSQYGLPLCIKNILCQGVSFDQRVACFRIAVNLKRVGLPEEFSVEVLNNWRVKNKPINNKRIITQREIKNQVGWAYKKNYNGIGCEEPIINSFCNSKCKLRQKNNNMR